MAGPTPDDALDELYRTPPTAFVARRTTLAAELVAAGDRPGAKVVKAAKRPTLAAWALNQLRDRAPDAVTEAGALAEEGRAVLTGEATGDPRALAHRRRAVVATLTGAALDVLHEHGEVSAAVERQVVETLDAALVSPEVAARLADARLLAAATATGFEGLLGAGGDEGPLARRRTAAGPGTRPDGSPELRVVDGGARRAELEAALDEAHQRAADADALVDRRSAEAAVAEEDLERAAADVRAAEAALRAAEARATQAAADRDEARGRRDDAETARRRAQVLLADATRAVDEHG